MLDYERIVSVIQRRKGVDRDTAWTAVSKAYLTLDTSRPEPEQAAYLMMVASLPSYLYDTGTEVVASSLDRDEEDAIAFIDTIADNTPVDSDATFVGMLIRKVPETYKVPTAMVILSLLKQDRHRKPLTIEGTRQYLNRFKFGNATELATQIYTFLTTIKEHL